MKVTVIGASCVGLAVGACLSELGNHVACIDVAERKFHMPEGNEVPICESELDMAVRGNAACGRLGFTTDSAAVFAAPGVLGHVAELVVMSNQDEAIDGDDALLIVAVRLEYKSNLEHIRRQLSQSVVIDRRKRFDPALTRERGIEYHGAGRGQLVAVARALGVAGDAS